MQAGRLDQKITIQSRSITRDEYGAETVTWVNFKTVYASVQPMAGRDYLLGRTLTDEIDISIRIRYTESIIPGMRITHLDHIYDIVSVQHMGFARRELVLMCREFVNNG